MNNMKQSKKLKQINKEIKLLYKKQKGLIKKKSSLIPLKQPVGQLMRRNSQVTFHEGLTGDKFEFTKSDGKEGQINLSPKFIQTFPYGNDYFKGYILHEDSSYPLGHEDILVYADQQKQAIDKIQGEELKLLAQLQKTKFEGWGTILMWIAGIILAFAVYKMLVPDAPIVQQATTAISSIPDKITVIK